MMWQPPHLANPKLKSSQRKASSEYFCVGTGLQIDSNSGEGVVLAVTLFTSMVLLRLLDSSEPKTNGGLGVRGIGFEGYQEGP